MSKVHELMRLADLYATVAGEKVTNREHLLAALEAALKPAQTPPLTDEQIARAWAGGDHNASAATKRRITRAIANELTAPNRHDRLEAAELIGTPPAQIPTLLTEDQLNEISTLMVYGRWPIKRVMRAVESEVRKQFGVTE